MIEANCLKQRIEQARHKLNTLEQQYDLCHPAVLRQSMLLDELINEFNRSSYAVPALRPFHSSEPVEEELWPTHSIRLRFV